MSNLQNKLEFPAAFLMESERATEIAPAFRTGQAGE